MISSIRQHGFSLLELLVTMAIFAVISALALGGLNAVVAEQTIAKAQMQRLAELQRMKYEHEQCESCMRQGAHVLFTYGDEKLDGLALENVARHHPEARLLGMTERHRRRPKGIRAWPRKARKQWDKLRRRVRRG